MKDFKAKATTSSETFDPQASNDARPAGLSATYASRCCETEPRRDRQRVASPYLGNEPSCAGSGPMPRWRPACPRAAPRGSRVRSSHEWDRLSLGRVSGPSAGLQTTRANLVETLKLAAHVLREPRWDPQEFEQLKNQGITAIMSQLTEPEARAPEAMSTHFNIYPKDDWRYVPTLEEALAETRVATLEGAKAFHDQFYGAAKAEIAIVGDFDEAAVTALLPELFAGWTPKVAYERVPSQHRDVPAADLT